MDPRERTKQPPQQPKREDQQRGQQHADRQQGDQTQGNREQGAGRSVKQQPHGAQKPDRRRDDFDLEDEDIAPERQDEDDEFDEALR